MCTTTYKIYRFKQSCRRFP